MFQPSYREEPEDHSPKFPVDLEIKLESGWELVKTLLNPFEMCEAIDAVNTLELEDVFRLMDADRKEVS